MKMSCVLVLIFCGATFSFGESRKTSGAAAVELRPALSLEYLNYSLQAVTKQVQPAVVQVLNSALVIENDSDRGGATFANLERSSGSGILISADGYIVTNAHVVQDSHRLRVRLNQAVKIAGNHLLDARLIGLDRETDFAVINVDLTGLPFLAFAHSGTLRQSQIVLAFGSPSGLDNSVSMGVVSAVDRQLDEDSPLVFIQTEAAINPRNSGGPSGGNEGLGFAISSNLARSICKQIRTERHVHHHEIGVSVRGITPELVQGLGLSTEEGILVKDIVAQSPAETAGVRVADIIIAVGDKPIPNVRQLALNMYMYQVGDQVLITVLR